MYSVVLMMAMSTAPDAVEFGRRGCTGCTGCTGTVVVTSCGGCYGSSCSGYSCSGSSCSGYSCSGSSCSGGSKHGGMFGGRMRSRGWSSCSGCCGGWSSSCCGGSSCSGWSASCSGSYPAPSGWSCQGAPIGCNGSIYPSYSFSCVGSSYSVPSYQSFYTPSEGVGCYGYGMPQAAMPYSGPVIVNPIIGLSPIVEEPKKEEPKKEEPKKDPKKDPNDGMVKSPTKAAVVVRLPADAKLYADGQLTALDTAERRFYTPTLDAGRDYHYNMKVEYVRDGKTVTDTKVVPVRAGEMAEVEFVDLTRVASRTKQPAMASSKVTIKLPGKAKLYVDNSPNPLADGTRVFNTPELPKGEEFFYVFRAEVVRDGKTESQTQQISFRAGEAVTVDFDGMSVVSK